MRTPHCEQPVEVEEYEDEDDMHVCIQRFDDAIEMLNVEEHYYVNNTFNKDNHSLMDPIRKLYIDKCNDNINLREEL